MGRVGKSKGETGICKIDFKTVVIADYGVEEAVSIDGIDKGAITKKLEELVKKGETLSVYAPLLTPMPA